MADMLNQLPDNARLLEYNRQLHETYGRVVVRCTEGQLSLTDEQLDEMKAELKAGVEADGGEFDDMCVSSSARASQGIDAMFMYLTRKTAKF